MELIHQPAQPSESTFPVQLLYSSNLEIQSHRQEMARGPLTTVTSYKLLAFARWKLRVYHLHHSKFDASVTLSLSTVPKADQKFWNMD